MSKSQEPLKRQTSTNPTKPKPIPTKITQKDLKPTPKSKAPSLIDKLIKKTSFIDDESSQQLNEVIQEDKVEIDQLYIIGVVSNCRDIDENVKNEYKVSQKGIICELNEYVVLILGRQQMKLKNGTKVGLYAPSAYKSAKSLQTGKITVLIQRKLKDNCLDPMQYPYFIVQPQQFLYPTYLCSWIECKRRITIEHYIDSPNQFNENMVFGNAIHKYLEWLVRKEVEAQEPTQDSMKKLYNEFLYDMYLTETAFEMFVEKCEVGIWNLAGWYQRHIQKGEKICLNKWQKKFLKIKKTIGSQVMMKSKYFGIKGKVDALFKGEYIDEKNNQNYEVYVPFELKTGKKQRDSYKKQVDIYVMLARQEKKTNVIGLLYYSQLENLQFREQNPLICYENFNNRRNKIVINYLNLYENSDQIEYPDLPEVYDQCKFCNKAVECAVDLINPQIKDLEDIGNENISKLGINDKIKGYSESQIKYIKKWMKMLHLEEIETRQMDKTNKQMIGCSSFQLQSTELQNFFNEDIEERVQLTLNHHYHNYSQLQVLQSIYKKGEKIRLHIPLIFLIQSCKVISIQKKQKKFLLKVEMITSDIKWNYHRVMQYMKKSESLNVEIQKFDNNFFPFLRGLIFQLCTSAEPWIKDLIINGKYEPQASQSSSMIGQKMIKNLNQDQKDAFRQCVDEEKFCLVEGMPGTGKTQLILKLIEHFYEEGLKVLVTSFTNQALVNILIRQTTKEKKIPPQFLIREGSKFNFSESLEYLTSRSQNFQNIQQYREYFKKKKIWFVTMNSLNIHHIPPLFDVVIVDEASQCLEPICLKALMKAKKFILIGDAKQLQPVVRSSKALELGMGESVFEKLSKSHPSQKVTLKKQYRMNSEIMNLSNQLVYEGMLQLAEPGTMQIRKLNLSEDWKSEQYPQYLRIIMNPQKPIRFVNYDAVLDLFLEESKNQTKIRRFLQIRITCMIYQSLRKLGLKREDILIISVFNSSVHEIVLYLTGKKLIDSNQGDVLTIDKSQGSDKEVIIFLFHKGNKELVENPRRLNVALTRAKNKFIIIGSEKYISQLAVWTGKLANLLKKDKIDIEKEFIEGILQNE